MSMCDLRRDGDVFVLTLTGDGEHRLNPTLIGAINGALGEVERSKGAAALVTTGEGKFFSNGLDLAWCQKQSPKQINEFMHSFMLLLARFMELGIPSVAALNGHAPAGGMMIALAHDYRLLNAERGLMFLSEVDIGLPFAPGMLAICRCKLPRRTAANMTISGAKYGGEEAVKAGIVDAAISGGREAVITEAKSRARALAAKKWDREVYSAIKKQFYKADIAELKSGDMGYGMSVGVLAKATKSKL